MAQEGFAIIPAVFSVGEIETTFTDFLTQNSVRSGAGVRHALRYPEIASMARSPKLLDLASEILGRPAFPYRSTLFDKSPEVNWSVVWHQDRAVPIVERKNVAGWGPWSIKDGVQYVLAPASVLSKIIALRICVDDSGPDSGPLRVIPGTHHSRVYTEHEIEAIVRKSTPISCTVKKGGVVAMRPLLLHSSSKATAALSRRVLHIEYAADKLMECGLELAIA
jgi:ectoine hydroxylase-related dioxygenase (phytanoyl-CoA dioxygenase family)